MTTDPATIIEAARRITLATPYGFLTTTGDQIQTRLVQHLDIADDCRITFSTGPGTRKAESIRQQPSVSYAVYDPDTQAAAAIYGNARFDDDIDRRQALWTDDLAPFFPDGPTADGFVLVTIDPSRVEVWSVPDELAPAPFGLSSIVIEQTSGGWTEATGTHPTM